MIKVVRAVVLCACAAFAFRIDIELIEGKPAALLPFRLSRRAAVDVDQDAADAARWKQDFNVSRPEDLNWLQKEAWPCKKAADKAAKGYVPEALGFSWSDDWDFSQGVKAGCGRQGEVTFVTAPSSSGGQVKLAVKQSIILDSIPEHFKKAFKLMAEREAKALKTLNFPTRSSLAVPGFVWFGMKDGKPTLVEEFVGGEDFLAHKKGRGAIEEVGLVNLLKRLIPTLGHMHNVAGLLHLDLKPENLQGEDYPMCADVKLLDFGLVRSHPDWGKVVDGEPPGTLSFMGLAKMQESLPDLAGGGRLTMNGLEDLEQLLFTAISLSSPQHFAAGEDFQGLPPDKMYQAKMEILMARDPGAFVLALDKYAGGGMSKRAFSLLFKFQQQIMKARNGEFDYGGSWIE